MLPPGHSLPGVGSHLLGLCHMTAPYIFGGLATAAVRHFWERCHTAIEDCSRFDALFVFGILAHGNAAASARPQTAPNEMETDKTIGRS